MLHHDDAVVEIAHRGATVVSWHVPDADAGLLEMGRGYRSPAALQENSSAAFAVMAPFVNRVAGGTYTFAGQHHDLRPAMHAADTEVIHGLVRRAAWEFLGAWQRDDSSTARWRHIIDDEPGYPFTIALKATYTLSRASFGIDLEARNIGERTAPIALGWHPYLQLPGHEHIDDLALDIAASHTVRTDSQLIPLPAEAAFAPVAGQRVHIKPIDARRLDDAFLLAGSTYVTTTLSSPTTGARIELRQDVTEAPLVHIFTGEALEQPRSAIAIEPTSALADAFNRPDSDQAITLPPGEVRRLRATLHYHHR